MEDIFSAEAIAPLLSEVWPLHKEKGFEKYLSKTCGTSPTTEVMFDCIYMAQAERGSMPYDILRNPARWWQVDDYGSRGIVMQNYQRALTLPSISVQISI